MDMVEEAAAGGKEVVSKKEEPLLPPGFRFHPTDEELITYYLINKISDANFTTRAIGDVDLNKSEPWDLPGKAKMGVKEWYFFSLRDRKYPTGVRTNRATNTGYWKTTGKDKEIYNSNTSELVGMKKTLVFYKGRAPRGEKSNWVMHEYRIHSKSAYRSTKDGWVVCRVFQKAAGGAKKYHPRPPNNPFPEIPQMIHPAHNFQFPIRNSYLPHQAATMINLPMPSQAGYNNLGPVGGSFTISGLNLNVIGGAAPPLLLPGMGQHEVLVNGGDSGMSQQEVLVSGGDNEAAGGYMNGMENRYVSMDDDDDDQCGDLDNYWPSY